MFYLKSIYLSKTATVNKYLKEGWEPFWGYPTTDDRGKPTVKMYFKKNDAFQMSPILKASSSTAKVKIQLDRTELDKLIEDFESLFESMATSLLGYDHSRKEDHLTFTMPAPSSKLLEVVDLNTVEERERLRKISEEEEIDEIQANEKIDLEQVMREEDENIDFENEAADLGWDGATTEAERMREAGESPAGDSFRVVEDIPPEVKAQLNNAVKTEAQEKAIEFLRSESKTNITVNPVRKEDGVIVVIRGNMIYEIDPNGVVNEFETGAKTSSLDGE